MLMSTMWVQDNVFLVYIFGTIGATILEYITGVAMEFLFKIKYWDYSDKMLNFKGYICMKSSLFWGALTVFLVYIVHPNVLKVVLKIDPAVLTAVSAFVLTACVIDTTIAFKNAFDLQKFLVYQTRIRTELFELTQRVSEMKDTIVGKENAGIIDVLKSQEERIDKLRDEMENAMSKIGNLKKSILRSFQQLHRQNLVKHLKM